MAQPRADRLDRAAVPQPEGGISINTGDDVALRFNWWVKPERVETPK